MNYFSKNLRFLRKREGLSQEKLAGKLGISRSNIAAYERKNVEPRLKLLIRMAELFDVGIYDFIQTDIAANPDHVRSFESIENEMSRIKPQDLQISSDSEKLKKFIEETIKLRKVLEGFRSFYQFKMENLARESKTSVKLKQDIENFLLLTEHLLTHNERVINALGGDMYK